ncbi:hypothetical protein TNCV_5066051 [Trichonephila clavipes]|nr:hypothetical protein TNCV_5066051 [Trichonephila clavipes]
MAFLGKGKKQDMLQLAEELGINATLNMTVPSIKIAITNSEGYEEEFVKNLYETIIANGKDWKNNWANLKSATQIAELFDNYEDVRKVNSKPMDRWGRNDKILTYLGVKEKENRFGKTSPRLGASVPEIEILNAVQTRSQVKVAREERGIDSGDAKKGEDEVIIVSSDAEDEILIPALQEYVSELALLRVTRENLINAQKNSEEIKSLYEQAASQVQVTNQVYSLEKELLVKNR